MTRLRRFAIAVLAAATVTVASLGVVPTASAQPMLCYQKGLLAELYWNYGNVFYSIGEYQQAMYWWGKAEGILEGC